MLWFFPLDLPASSDQSREGKRTQGTGCQKGNAVVRHPHGETSQAWIISGEEADKERPCGELENYTASESNSSQDSANFDAKLRFLLHLLCRRRSRHFIIAAAGRRAHPSREENKWLPLQPRNRK